LVETVPEGVVFMTGAALVEAGAAMVLSSSC
jgi:hypothetical protein